MAQFRIETKINDGKREAPPVKIEAEDIEELCDALAEFGTNDHAEFFGVGSTIFIERI